MKVIQVNKEYSIKLQSGEVPKRGRGRPKGSGKSAAGTSSSKPKTRPVKNSDGHYVSYKLLKVIDIDLSYKLLKVIDI